jgi:hypothetical protein
MSGPVLVLSCQPVTLVLVVVRDPICAFITVGCFEVCGLIGSQFRALFREPCVEDGTQIGVALQLHLDIVDRWPAWPVGRASQKHARAASRYGPKQRSFPPGQTPRAWVVCWTHPSYPLPTFTHTIGLLYEPL